jgi:hypothetical protein
MLGEPERLSLLPLVSGKLFLRWELSPQGNSVVFDGNPGLPLSRGGLV